MKIPKNEIVRDSKPIEADFFGRLWKESWTYIKTVVDVVREPVLILDKDFRVMAANEPFYQTFQVDLKDTENKLVYDLGNGQWNIPALRKLLEDILPKHSFFKGFEVAHDFPFIGRKVMILNARQIHFKENAVSGIFPPIILLAMEDMTEVMGVAQTIASHAQLLESRLTDRLQKLEMSTVALEREVDKLKKL